MRMRSETPSTTVWWTSSSTRPAATARASSHDDLAPSGPASGSSRAAAAAVCSAIAAPQRARRRHARRRRRRPRRARCPAAAPPAPSRRRGAGARAAGRGGRAAPARPRSSRVAVELLRGLQQQRLVEAADRAAELAQPVHDRRRRDAAEPVAGVASARGRRLVRRGDRGEAGDRALLEDVARAHARARACRARLTSPIATMLSPPRPKKSSWMPTRGRPERLREQRRQRALGRRARLVGAGQRGEVRRGQRGAVELAVRASAAAARRARSRPPGPCARASCWARWARSARGVQRRPSSGRRRPRSRRAASCPAGPRAR